MLSKVQSDYLKSDLVLQGVWDTIVKESPLTTALHFKAINNDIIKYNLELTMPTVSWLQPKESPSLSHALWLFKNYSIQEEPDEYIKRFQQKEEFKRIIRDALIRNS